MRLKNQQKAKEFLEKLHTTNRVPNAILLYGLPGVGKTTCALEFAKGLLCFNDTPWGCGSCPSCKHMESIEENILNGSWGDISLYEDINGKKVLLYLSGEHPDFIFVPPSGVNIRIDQVRAVKDFANVKPALSKRKVVVIDESQRMNREASNAILKVLEEPPMDTFFLLTSQGKDTLLPTIISRTYQIELSPLEKEVFFELLGNENEELYEISGGSLTLAKKIHERGEVINFVRDFLSKEPSKVYDISIKVDKLKEDDKELFLELLESKFRENFLRKELNYDRFEMLLSRLSELRRGLGRGLKLNIGLLSLYAIWR